MISHLEKHDPAKNQKRFYRLSVQPNLFGEWTLFKEWGRISSQGTLRLEWYVTKDEAETVLFAIEKKKKRKGYILVPMQLALF